MRRFFAIQLLYQVFAFGLAADVTNSKHKRKEESESVRKIKDILKKMRVLDDKIVYALNTSLPTESFQGKVDASSVCQDLFSQIRKGHLERENVIKNCIVVTAESVINLKAVKAEKPDDFETLKNLKAEQRKLRLLQTELSVEEVIKEKTTKLFTEKCRTYYKPETS